MRVNTMPATMRRLCALAAAPIILSACSNRQSEAVTSIEPDPMAREIAERPPVELPPMIKADVTMRCKDNSLVYVTFFTGDKLAAFTTVKDGIPTRLTAEEAGAPFLAEGYSLTGTPTSITLTLPGKDTLVCKR